MIEIKRREPKCSANMMMMIMRRKRRRNDHEPLLTSMNV
jgi:hypothetical protein